MAERPHRSSPAAPARPGPLALLGGRVGRHTVLYGGASVVTLVASLVSVAVVTRYLSPRQYGDLAVLLFFSAMVTILINLGSLQGTFAWAFAGGGSDEDDAEVALAGSRSAPDRRRAYMTGVAVTAAAGAAAVVVVVPLAPEIAGYLVGRPGAAGLVELAVAAAAGQSVWRLTVNALRLARRPIAYVGSVVFVNVAALATTVALLAAGGTIGAVLAGQAAGAVAAVALNLVLARADLRWAVSLSDAREIYRRGRAMIPVVLSFQTIMLADVFLLSRTLPAADVGLYRVASRVGSVVSHISSAILMAWGGLRRDPLHHAAQADTGRADATLAKYYTVTVAGAILATAVLSDLLVRIAGPSYSGAAELIPATAVAFGFHGWYVVSYRTAGFGGKRRWFISLSVVIAVTFTVLTLALAGPLDAYAALVAAVAAWSLGIAGMGIRGRLSATAVPMASRAVIATLAAAGACYGIDRALVDPSSVLGSLQGAWVLLLYPALLVAWRVISPADIRTGLRVARAPRMRRHLDALNSLDAFDRALLVRCLARREPREVVAEDLLITTDEAGRRIVAALRRVGGLGAPQPADDRVARYLLDQHTFVERDELGRQLVSDDVDAGDLDALRRIAARVARTTRGTPAPEAGLRAD